MAEPRNVTPSTPALAPAVSLTQGEIDQRVFELYDE
jgi:hypothetical protein